MKMHNPPRGVVVPALLLLLGGFVGVASAQTVTFANRPTPGTVGIIYSFQFQISPPGTYTFTCACTTMAPGLSLSSSGAITGTPTSAGSFNFTVTATDPLNSANTTGPVQWTILIGAQPLTIATTSVPNSIKGATYSTTMSASGGSGSYSWSLFSGSLPPALSIASSGLISGTTTTAGNYTFRVTVTDSLSSVNSLPLSITVNNPNITLGPGSLSAGIVNGAYSQTFAASGGTGGPYVYSVSSGSLPANLTLNASTGILSGTPSAAGSFNFSIGVSDGSSFTPAFSPKPYSILIYPPVTISSSGSGLATDATASYSETFLASGGTGAGYSYAISSAPGGLSFNKASGVLSGSPVAGSYPFTITATDGGGFSGSASYTLSVNPALTLSPSTVSSAQVGTPYSQTFTGSGGAGGYSYTFGGQMPGGLGFNAGALSGTPTAYGTFPFSVTVKDSLGIQTVNNYTLSIAPLPLTLSPATLANGIAGTKYSQSFTAGGGTGNYTITLTSNPPPGLSLSASGGNATLSGTPTSSGSFPVTIQVADGVSTPLSRSYTLAISGAPLSISSTSLPAGTQNAAYTQNLTAAGGAPPYTWTVTSGTLPPGLGLSPGGAISGAPGGYGTYSFTVTVTDSANSTASASFSISVQPAPLVITTTSPLPPAVSGVSYSAGLSASGGMPPYAFSLNSGPPGLSVLGSSLVGKMTNLGVAAVTYNVSVGVRDSAGSTAGAGLTLSVQPAAAGIVLSAGSLSFTAVAGGASPAPQFVSAASTTAATPPFTAGSNQSWLSVSPASGNAPATLQIGVDPSKLVTGSYSGTITVTGPDGPHTVAVSLQVGPATPQISVAPNIVSFSSDGTSLPSSGGIQISNTGTGNLNYSASVANGSSWVNLGAGPGIVAAGTPVTIPVSASIAGLHSGDYRDVVHITSDGGNADVPVTLLIASASTINLSPTGALFSSRESQGIANGTRTFSILTTGTNSVTWAASLPDNAPWLTLNTTAGAALPGTPSVVTYKVDPTALTAGNYYARIRITAPSTTNSPLDFLVVASVAPATILAIPDPTPAGLLFISQPGSPVPPAQNIVVNTSSSSVMNFSVAANTSSGGSWLAVSPMNGIASSASPGNVTVTINPAGLSPGVYQGGVSFTIVGNPTGVRTVNVVLLVTGSGQSSSSVSGAHSLVTTRSYSPDASCSPSKLVAIQTGLVSNFSTPAGWPVPLAIQLVNDCGSAITSGQVVATFSNGDAPLALQLSDNKNAVYSATWTPHGASQQVTVSARATATNLADATAQIIGSVSANQAPILYKHGTIHNMNPQPGASLAPGTIVQIYGSGLAPSTLQTSLPLPTIVNGTIAIIGGIQAPLYYVSDGQLNAQLPFELAPGRQYQILISANGALTTPDTIDIEAATPGVAMLGSGAVIAQHADSSYVTAASPAHAGETLTIYLAGMGLTDQSVKTGQLSPSSPLAHPDVAPTVTVNGENSTIAFAGLTPGSVGLYQINFQVPSDAPSGNLPLIVSQGTAVSNTSNLPVQ
jgi:uncharacterized protein (TIGR03437 family)